MKGDALSGRRGTPRILQTGWFRRDRGKRLRFERGGGVQRRLGRVRTERRSDSAQATTRGGVRVDASAVGKDGCAAYAASLLTVLRSRLRPGDVLAVATALYKYDLAGTGDGEAAAAYGALAPVWNPTTGFGVPEEFFKILVPPSNPTRFPRFLDRPSSLPEFSTTGERSLKVSSETLKLKVS